MTRVLILDDDTDILESIKDLLEMEKFEVIPISKGEDALPNIRKHTPDVILLDLLLSGEDGAEICKQLKSIEATKNIPVILMSAHPSAKTHALQAGANDFIAKPFDADVIIEKIKACTRKSGSK